MGKIGDRKRADCKKAVDHYYSRFKDDFSDKAPCQLCQRLFERRGLDCAHKHSRGRGGNEHFSNILALCRMCHQFMDAKPTRQSVLERSPASVDNGERLKLPQEMSENHQEFLITGTDKFKWE